MKRLYVLLSVLTVLAFLLSACGGQSQAEDLLAEIKQRGTIVVSTDPNYEPQSFLNTSGTRASGTKCASDQFTAGEMQGFDVDVALEIGKRLGAETCFATPSWDAITAGNWADKWDISVGSMTITTERQKILTFTTPYYYAPAVVAAANGSGITQLSDLEGKALCVGTATTYETWATGGDLGFPPSSIYASVPANVTVVPLETDQECAQAIQAGRTEFQAYSTASTVVNSNTANGLDVSIIAEVYAEELAVAIDKQHTLPIDTLVAELDKIVNDMHADGTLSQLSTKWFGEDLTQKPGN